MFSSMSLGQFKSVSMRERDYRLKTSKKEADQCVKDLSKDRLNLERKEKQLMGQLRTLIKKGDLPKAKILASQIAQFRNISDRNFARSAYIQTETQLRISNHKINQAHIEFLKGMNFANYGESIEAAKLRERKYHQRQDMQETMESILNEGFQEGFEEQESEREDPPYFDAQVQAILREGIDAQLKVRDYTIPKQDSIREMMTGHARLFLRIYQAKDGDVPDKEAAISIPTLEISVDMLKKYIQRDGNIVKQLGLFEIVGNSTISLQIGTVSLDADISEKGTFCSLESSKSLKSQGVDDDQTLWIYSP